jgi:hypothetical protein
VALTALWARNNLATDGTTHVESEYIEVVATRICDRHEHGPPEGVHYREHGPPEGGHYRNPAGDSEAAIATPVVSGFSRTVQAKIG